MPLDIAIEGHFSLPKVLAVVAVVMVMAMVTVSYTDDNLSVSLRNGACEDDRGGQHKQVLGEACHRGSPRAA